ncbi:RimK family alpha-L-glutamate ligase [Algoriphagus sp. AK58]|uniref:ATP-grasp domain-containing protein n=1 Tax=Algoriphagus sp. AK58 TaxID=1406877 RepID=UPI00164F52C2|nr:glutathione synthetase [Algoriphagus sp. AK58]MBC6365180.1 glutathione synthetase [Algoriphagus sp. AK58]
MSQHIAIVSYFSTGAYDTNTIDEDKLLSEILTELGVSHEIQAWSDPNVDWSSFSLLLIKSTWDYFDFYPEFLLWIEKIKALGIPVLNDLDIVRWNSSKDYLLEIESQGFPTIAGVMLEKGSKPTLDQIQKKVNSDTIVVKPLVSGGAKNTLRIPVSEWSNFEEKVTELVKEEAFLAQPYVKEVSEVGEYSLIFFNQQFSHAVLKTPAKSDFRVQHYYGGTIQEIQPDSSLLEPAQKLIDTFGKGTLYGRVDGVLIDGVFYLMELELIEPYLFLGLSDKAIPNYREALKRRLML